MAVAAKHSSRKASSMQKGTLIMWNDQKGFGFIRPDENEEDHFVHISAFKKGMTRRPTMGDVVRFQPAETSGKKTRRLRPHRESGTRAPEASALRTQSQTALLVCQCPDRHALGALGLPTAHGEESHSVLLVLDPQYSDDVPLRQGQSTRRDTSVAHPRKLFAHPRTHGRLARRTQGAKRLPSQDPPIHLPGTSMGHHRPAPNCLGTIFLLGSPANTALRPPLQTVTPQRRQDAAGSLQCCQERGNE